MKILYIGDMDSPHCYKLADFYINKGYEILSVTEVEPVKKVNGVVYHYLISRNTKRHFIFRAIFYLLGKLPKPLGSILYYEVLLIVLGYYKFVSKIDTDIVHAHYAITGGVVAYKSKITDFMLSCWGSDILLRPFESKYNYKLVCKIVSNAVKINTSAPQLTDILIKRFGLSPKKIIEKQYGLENWVIDALSKNELDVSSNSDNNCYFIATRGAKGVYDNETILGAAKILLKKLPQVKIIMISGGPLHETYKQIIANEKLINVKLYNQMTQVELFQHMKKARYYLSSSLSDGLSISLLECFAAKLYPIVTDIKANRNVIKHIQNGRLFACGDITGLVNQITEVIKNQDEYRRVIDLNYRWLRENQNMEKNLSELANEMYKDFK